MDPVTALYFPATQNTHSPPSGPVEPALQVHAVETLLPDGALAFAGHVKQAELCFAPTVAEYVPRPQSVHAVCPTSALYLPAAHATGVVEMTV